jgi:hypothetical protein
MVGILNRVGMLVTTTGTGSVTASTLISNKFLSPAEAGAVNGQQYYWMLEEGSDFELFIGTWTASGTTVSRDTVLVSKIAGTKGTTKLTLAGNAALRSISPQEAFAELRLTKAAASDLRTGTDDAKYMTAKAIRDAFAFVALTDASTIAIDMATGFNFSATLGGNRTLGAPSNSIAGQAGLILITQDGTGSRTLSFNSAWKFAGGTPTASTAAGTVDAIAYTVTTGGGSPIIRATYIKGFA